MAINKKLQLLRSLVYKTLNHYKVITSINLPPVNVYAEINNATYQVTLFLPIILRVINIDCGLNATLIVPSSPTTNDSTPRTTADLKVAAFNAADTFMSSEYVHFACEQLFYDIATGDWSIKELLPDHDHALFTQLQNFRYTYSPGNKVTVSGKYDGAQDDLAIVFILLILACDYVTRGFREIFFPKPVHARDYKMDEVKK